MAGVDLHHSVSVIDSVVNTDAGQVQGDCPMLFSERLNSEANTWLCLS